MALRAAVRKFNPSRSMESTRGSTRYYSDGRVFGEEERAAENIYIKKMEKERLEKPKQKAEKEKEWLGKGKDGGLDKDATSKS